MRIAKIKYLLQMLSLFVLVTSCLPTQKTTECSSSEAFDATRRKCVPTLGAGIGNTVFIQSNYPANSYSTSLGDAGINHTISVSDVYAVGYKIQWRLHFSSSVSPVYNFNNSLVASNALNYTFTPPSVISPNLKGTYIVEAVVLNNGLTAQLDSHSWTIQVGDLAVPELINPVPAVIATTYAINLGAQLLSLDVDNPDGRSITYKWFTDSMPGTTGVIGGSTTLSESITPSLLGIGIHTLELKLFDSGAPGIVFDTYIWTINIISPNYPAITTATPSFSDTIIAIDGIDYSSGGYLDSNFTALNTLPTPGLCINVDNYDKDGNFMPDLDVQFDINGAIQGALAQIGITNQYCLTTIAAQNLVNPQIGVSKTLTVSTYVSGTATLVEQRQWPLIVNPKNSAPIIAIESNPANSTILCGPMSTLSASGCTIVQSSDTDNDNSYTDEIPANNNSVQVAFSIYDMETDFVATAGAYGEDNLEIYFQIKAATDISFQEMDGSADKYSRTICSAGAATPKASFNQLQHAAGITTGYSQTYICTLNLDSFDTDGVNDTTIASGAYIVRAYVRDAGSVWSPANQQQSPYVTWNINVTELNSDPTVLAQGTTATPTTNSWIASNGVGTGTCHVAGTVLNTLTGTEQSEDCEIEVHTIIRDSQRDNINILVELENALLGPGLYSLAPAVTTVNNSYIAATGVTDDSYKEIVSTFKIPQWAVTSDSIARKIRVSVNEITDAGASGTIVQSIFQIDIDNNNPPPIFASIVNPNLSLDSFGGAEQTYVFAGFPFTLDPENLWGITPNIASDASLYDGTNITWQWQINYDGGGYVDIPNANNTNMSDMVLKWTPSIDVFDTATSPLSTISLRICLGDDGAGNPADCSNAASTREYTNIKVAPANFQGSDGAISSGNELATWYDEANETLYNAYVQGTDIYISKYEKTGISWNTAPTHTISFSAEDPSVAAPAIPLSLSISGKSGATLLVAYKVAALGGAQNARLRQIDISAEKLGFKYGGIFDDSGVMAAYDMIDSYTSVNLIASDLSTSGLGGVDITFDGTETAADGISFNLSNGSTLPVICTTCITGTGIGNANAFATLLLATTLNEEVSITLNSNIVELRGVYIQNSIDFGHNTDTIGNIVFDSTNDYWYLPYKNLTTGGLSIYNGINASNHLNSLPPGSYDSVGGTLVSQYISADLNHLDRLVVAHKNSSANVDLYEFDNPVGAGIVSSASDIFSFTGGEIADVQLSSGLTGDLYLGAKYVNGINSFIATAAVKEESADSNSSNGLFDDIASSSTFASFNYLADTGIDKVKISASRTPASDFAVIAVTTNSSHANIPNQAHLAKITTDFSNITFQDYQISASYLSSPKVNINSTIDSAAISLTPIYQIQTGHKNDYDGALADSTQYSLFFSFHESNGGSEVRSTMLNIESNSTSTDDTSVIGSMPGILAD